MQAAFVTTRLLEPSLQAVTRTAIRRMDNTSPIKLFVQDERVARYLMETYLPDAVIDWSLSKKIPVKLDGRKKEHPQQQEALALIQEGVPNKEIARRIGVSPKTIRNWIEKSIAA
jgi:DNA-binding NarL/FixJ family response regulator